MKFFVVTYRKDPWTTLYVESTISGFCIFTKYSSRAKFFREEEADELVIHLKRKKFNERNNFSKLEVQDETNDRDAIRETRQEDTASNS